MLDSDVVVIGAGLAGLTAARHLEQAGRSVVVLEARDRVGGRTWTEPGVGGLTLDLGAQWLAPWQTRMHGLIRELGLETFPTFDEGDNLALWRGRTYRYSGLLPRLPLRVLADIGQAQVRFERMARRVPVEAPWSAERAETWDAQTFDTWIRRNCFTRSGRAFFRLFADGIFAVEAAHVSLLHALFYARSSESMESLISVEGGGQQDRIVGGAQSVANGLRDRIRGPVLLGRCARRVEWGAAGVRVRSGGESYRARRAIITVPPVLAGRIEFEPPLPGDRDQLLQSVPAGSAIKCQMVYDEPFWRADGLSGQAAADSGVATLTFDNSPPAGTPGVLLTFLTGRTARSLGACSETERRAAVIDSVTRFFGERARKPAAYVEQDWNADPWSRGAYGGHFAPGVWTGHGRLLRRPLGPIHWAGAETASVAVDQMEGAVESGERGAREVVEALASTRPAAVAPRAASAAATAASAGSAPEPRDGLS